MIRIALCVFLGSGIGGTLRYAVSAWVGRLVARNTEVGTVASIFPWATFGVNVIGCFIIGILYGLINSGMASLSDEMKAMLTTGFCGGLTTFSTFSNENYLLFQSHGPGIALLYAFVSLLAGFLAAWAGSHTPQMFVA